MKACQLLQALVAFSGQMHIHSAPVAAAGAAPDQPRRRAPRYQRHDPVLLGLKPLGEFSYRRPFPAGKALDLEQQEVLQRCHSIPARNLFAEAEETAQLIAKMGTPLEIGFCHVNGRCEIRLFHRPRIYHNVILSVKAEMFPAGSLPGRSRRDLAKVMNPTYYFAGPPAMTMAMQQMLDEIRIDEQAMRYEGFCGY